MVVVFLWGTTTICVLGYSWFCNQSRLRGPYGIEPALVMCKPKCPTLYAIALTPEICLILVIESGVYIVVVLNVRVCFTKKKDFILGLALGSMQKPKISSYRRLTLTTSTEQNFSIKTLGFDNEHAWSL